MVQKSLADKAEIIGKVYVNIAVYDRPLHVMQDKPLETVLKGILDSEAYARLGSA
jgi:hypothetical protein